MKQIKLLIPVLLLSLFSLSSFSQENNSIWLTNYEEALALSKKENKRILMSFTGSDWCTYCKRLDKVVFISEVFKEYATANFVLLNLDFPAKKKNELSAELTKQNEELAEKYNSKASFPRVLIVNSEGTVLAITGYKKLSAEAYVEHLKTIAK